MKRQLAAFLFCLTLVPRLAAATATMPSPSAPRAPEPAAAPPPVSDWSCAYRGQPDFPKSAMDSPIIVLCMLPRADGFICAVDILSDNGILLTVHMEDDSDLPGSRAAVQGAKLLNGQVAGVTWLAQNGDPVKDPRPDFMTTKCKELWADLPIEVKKAFQGALGIGAK